MSNPYQSPEQSFRYGPVEKAAVSDRVRFMRRTYAHLAGAILVFVLLETLIVTLFGATLEPLLLKLRGPMWLVALLTGGFSLGVWFPVAMVALASAIILYNTSNVMHHYNTEQHVAASLALFSSVALLFWYVLQLFMSQE